jgi:hypothetical protein
MSARQRRPGLKHGKAHKRKSHCHQLDADARWLDAVADWPDDLPGAEPDGALVPLPGPGGSHHLKGKLRGETA